MHDTRDRKRHRWLRCDRDKRDQGEFNICGLQWILWTKCCLKDSRWLFTKDYMWRVAPNTKWESQIPNKSNLPNSYKPCWFRWDFTIESIFWGGWKWVILCFPVGQKFIRWLCPHFARNFFLSPVLPGETRRLSVIVMNCCHLGFLEQWPEQQAERGTKHQSNIPFRIFWIKWGKWGLII